MIQFKRIQTMLPALAVLIAAGLVIGCGGGGGGTVTTTSTTSTATTSTATTATGTTSTATTSTATSATGTTTGLTDGGIAGVLMPNTIYYSEGVTSVRTIKPDGTGDALLATIPDTISAAVPNPVVVGQWFFAYRSSASGLYGIYRNASLTISGAVQIVTPTYSSVTSLQASPDGSTLFYVASTSLTPGQIFKVATISGTPLALDFAESAHLNMKGDYLVYGRYNATLGRAQIVKRSSADSATAAVLVNDSNDDLFPQWNRAGDKVVFKAALSPTGQDLFVVKSDGTSLLKITNTPGTDKLAASFSPDGTQVAFGAVNVDPAQTGIYKTGTTAVDSGTTLVKADSAISEQIYWTGTNGRSSLSSIAMIRSSKRRLR